MDCTNAAISECRTGDGCCPRGCVHSTDEDCEEGTAELGDPCLVNVDCASGTCLSEELNGWPDGYCSQGCSDDRPCPEGSHCGYTNAEGVGFCMISCDGDCERAPEYGCYDRDRRGADECAPVGIGEGAPGGPCESVADCAGGERADCGVEYYDFRGGYCTVSCSDEVACPEGSHCGFQDEDGNGWCLASCEGDGDCREDGYMCYDRDGDEMDECHMAATGDGAVGDACEGLWDCAGGLFGICGGPEGGWPEGYCTLFCTPDVGVDCTGDSTCVEFGEGQHFCIDGCTRDRECREDYGCTDGGCLPI